MSHFYGIINGQAGQATRAGSKTSGLSTQAASWAGAIEVQLLHNKATGKDSYIVSHIPWHGAGVIREIARGIIGGSTI